MKRCILTNLFLMILFFGAGAVFPQTTEFSYQGFLNDASASANGLYDFEFRLFDAQSGGTAVATLPRTATVVNGVFNVVLDFGAFPSANRYLEIAVRRSGVGGFSTMLPRTKMISTPYATYANNASAAQTAANALQLGGVAAGQFVQTNDARLSDSRNPLPNSASYVQNTTTPQTAANFNVTGNGTVGGTLTGNVVNAVTDFNIAGGRVLSIAGVNNLFAGTGAGVVNTTGANNTFVGRNAGSNNVDNSNNSFFGYEAGKNSNAENNSFFGSRAGQANTFGGGNSFFGMETGMNNAGGVINSFFGAGAGRAQTSGIGNSLFGASAGQKMSGSIYNTYAGTTAGFETTTGSENSFFGASAGYLTTTGSDNVFVGWRAGEQNVTGSNNTALGASADFGNGFLTNATAIGARARVEQSNTIVLGSINGVNGASANTDVGIGVTAPARKLDVSGNIRIGATNSTLGCVEDRDGTVIAGTCSSDARLKKDVSSFGAVLNDFAKLRPVNYYWRADEFAAERFGKRQAFGLVAQEVEALFPELVATDDKGFKAVNYSKLPLLTVQAVKELKAENDALKRRLELQAESLAAQRKELREQRAAIDELRRFVRRPKTRRVDGRKRGARR